MIASFIDPCLVLITHTTRAHDLFSQKISFNSNRKSLHFVQKSDFSFLHQEQTCLTWFFFCMSYLKTSDFS